MEIFDMKHLKKVLGALGLQDIDFFDMAENAKNEFEKESENIPKINILVIGKTGAGKSTLVNAMFRDNFAETGIGRPVSKGMKVYTKDKYPLRIYDTRGIELDPLQNEETKKEIKDVMESLFSTGREEDRIHIIWYLINTMSARIEDCELNWINELSSVNGQVVPVILVLSKAVFKNETEEFKKNLEQRNLNVQAIVPVLAMDYVIEKNKKIKAYGLTELNDKTISYIPDGMRLSYINAQKVDIKVKLREARKVVDKYTTGAGAIGLVPIPVPDAPLLMSAQISMLSGINKAFGIDLDRNTNFAIITAVVGIMCTTYLGKSLVSGIFKAVPGAGTAVGAVISGTTALSLTKSLGEIYILLLSEISYGKISRDKESVLKEFKNLLKKKNL